MNKVKFGLVLAAIGCFVFACANNTQVVNTNLQNNELTSTAVNIQPADTPNEMASVKKMYVDNCAKCHKEDGSGGKVVIDGETIKADSLISENKKKDSDEEIFGHIKNGIPDEGMPAFKSRLNDEQTKMLVKYIRTDLQNK